MIGLFFEVEPLAGHADRYFELAAHLRPELDKNPGLLFIDRYSSLDRPGIVLSHSWWDTEASLIAWREHTGHRAIQRAGREQHFRDYRLRIGRLSEAAADHAARRVYVGYLDGEPARLADTERFKSVYRENKFLALSASAPIDITADQRVFDVIRDYTMYDRTEAPQDYPPVRRLQD
jgi:heme-degrading monooxygenase HmoA